MQASSGHDIFQRSHATLQALMDLHPKVSRDRLIVKLNLGPCLQQMRK